MIVYIYILPSVLVLYSYLVILLYLFSQSFKLENRKRKIYLYGLFYDTNVFYTYDKGHWNGGLWSAFLFLLAEPMLLACTSHCILSLHQVITLTDGVMNDPLLQGTFLTAVLGHSVSTMHKHCMHCVSAFSNSQPLQQ